MDCTQIQRIMCMRSYMTSVGLLRSANPEKLFFLSSLSVCNVMKINDKVRQILSSIQEGKLS